MPAVVTFLLIITGTMVQSALDHSIRRITEDSTSLLLWLWGASLVLLFSTLFAEWWTARRDAKAEEERKRNPESLSLVSEGVEL